MYPEQAEIASQLETGLAKPLILKIGELRALNPFLLFILITTVMGTITWSLGGPTITPILLAYMVAFVNYLERSHRKNFEKLAPIMRLAADKRGQQLASLSHFPKWRLRMAYFFSVPMMLFVNWSHPEVQAFLSGSIPGIDFFWGLLVAIITWVVILQVGYIVISNTMTFVDLARSHLVVDIFDIRSMLPFTMVGVSNILFFAGGYTLVPIAYFDSGTLILPAMMSLLFSLPTGIALFFLPIVAVRSRILREKTKEIDAVTLAIHGDREALKNTSIADEADTITRSNLIIYRDLVERTSEWPITNSSVKRLGIYIVVPLLAWVGAALVERTIDSFF